jgi:hypothetical protein
VAGAHTFPAPLTLTLLVMLVGSSSVSEGSTHPQYAILVFSLRRAPIPPHCPFRNQLNIPGALITNCSPKAFLSIRSDVLSILRCSYRVVPGSFIPILHSGPFQHFILDVRPFGFSVPYRLFLVSVVLASSIQTLLHSTSTHCRLWPIPSAVHSFPGSEIF